MVKRDAPRPNVQTLIARERDALDRLEADMSMGFRSQGHYDECEGRMQAITRRLNAAFRGQRGMARR